MNYLMTWNKSVSITAHAFPPCQATMVITMHLRTSTIVLQQKWLAIVLFLRRYTTSHFRSSFLNEKIASVSRFARFVAGLKKSR